MTTTIRIFDEDFAIFKAEIPNLILAWGLTDDDVLKIKAADVMCKTFASKPASWRVLPRTLCDDAVLGYRLEIDEADVLPLTGPGAPKSMKEINRETGSKH